FRDMGVHVLDAAWWIMGTPQPVSVSGVAGAEFGPKGKGYWNFNTPSEDVYSQYNVDDYAGGIIRFEGGSALQVESFWASHQSPELQIEIFGNEAGAQLTPLTVYRTVHNAPQDVSVDLPEGPSGWDMIAAHFIECILEGKECEAPLRHGMVVQEMLEAILESGEKGREIRLDGSN
ncbi:MAG: Gfo/Idh/MocA family oxidoreductase, partial [Planctomycetes bacterium]|nr:Gfo/Idh/MocA family oxidoreductase [Planctomycetota bacterium]